MLIERRRDRLRAETYAEIKELARRQMADNGAAALSLRNIAQQMGLSTPALYRYFDNRDALVTALIVESYTALGEALEHAAAFEPADDPTARLWAMLLAYRQWAVARPADYALILGNPIPGYHAPAEATLPVVRRAFAPLFAALQDAWERGQMREGTHVAVPADLRSRLEGWQREQGFALPAAVAALALLVWGTVHGLVSLELFNHLQPIVGDPEPLYRRNLRSLLEQIGLSPAPE